MADELGADWELEIDLSGVKAPTGGAPLVQGYYRVKIESMVPSEKNADRLQLKLKFPEGQVRTDGINKPKSADDVVRVYWRGLCESVGYQPGQLDKGEVKLKASAFVGKTAHIFFTPKDEANGRQYDRTSYLPPAAWEEQKAAFESKTPNETKSTGTASTNGVTARSTSSAVSEDEVRRILNA
jgi:hypothetical protein